VILVSCTSLFSPLQAPQSGSSLCQGLLHVLVSFGCSFRVGQVGPCSGITQRLVATQCYWRQLMLAIISIMGLIGRGLCVARHT
jgi:hypothetical protein